MELDDIRRQALAAREFQRVLEHATFTLRIPTRHETTRALLRAGPHDDEARLVVAERLLLEQALVRWSGVRVSDVLRGASHAAKLPPDELAAALPHEPGAVPLLLDAQPDWARELGLALVDAMATRNAEQDTAAKN